MAKRSTIADPMPRDQVRETGIGFWLGLLALVVIAMGLFSCVGTQPLQRIATDTGLEYQVLRDGEGPSPTLTDTVLVHYQGELADGTVFDSSYARGEPAAFGVGQVIPGFAEGLQMMETGAKYRFFIPSELGYGASGAGNAIPPNSDLMFEVELIAIAPPGMGAPPLAPADGELSDDG
ncbi:MAG: FKBP-type peptidyl-prolyl cis-trans isomerase [Pacificimonas sp.]